MDYEISGKKAVVLAGTLGLGRSVARQLLAEGCDVATCSRNEDNVESFLAEASNVGGQAVATAADLSNSDDVSTFFDFVEDKLGAPDILVTNAGGPPPGRFEDFDDSHWQAAFDLTLLSAVRSIRRVLPGMQERGWGRIVAITSISVKSPVDNLILSNSLRAGLTGCLKTLATEAGPSGVTVNAVCPGYTETDRMNALLEHRARLADCDRETILQRMAESVPVGRMATPEELAGLVCYLCSRQAASINGVSFQVDGGLHRGLL